MPGQAIFRQVDKYQTLCMVSSNLRRERRHDETRVQSQPRHQDRLLRLPPSPAGPAMRSVTAELARVISIMNPWVLTDPHQLARPVTGVRGHPGLWLTDLPSRLSPGGNAPRF